MKYWVCATGGQSVALSTTNPSSHMVSPGITPKTSWCEASNYNLHSWRNKEHIKFKICISCSSHLCLLVYFVDVKRIQTKGRKYTKEFKNRALGTFGQKWEEHKGKENGALHVAPPMKYYCNDQILRGWSRSMRGIDCKCIWSYVWKTYRANYIFKTHSCIWDTTKVNF